MKAYNPRALGLMALLILVTAIAFAQDDRQAGGNRDAASRSGAGLMAANSEGRYSYLIEFAEAELLRHPGRSRGAPVDLQSTTMMAAREELMAAQARHVQRISARLNRDIDPSHHYLAAENGIAVWLSEREAERIASLDGVKRIRRTRVYKLDTFNGPAFIGAEAIWDGSAVPGGSALLGQGMVAAILDSGIPDPATHDSFGNVAACDHGGSNPDKVISALDCSSSDGSGLCNGSDPYDSDGHGSHTASTVAGNTVDSSSTPAANPPGSYTELSGVAPCAHIRSYKVCPGSSCPGADILAGLESVLIHGDADVMNFSISGGTDPWVDNDRIKLDLVDADVFVAASAGNTSPTVPDPVGQVNHRGPWVMSVAASTRPSEETAPQLLVESNSILLDQGSASPVGGALTDHPLTYYSGHPLDAQGCTAFPADFFAGSIALIRRGGCTFTDKINNAVAAGADMVMIWNNTTGAVSMDTSGQDAGTPAYSMSESAGQYLVGRVDAGGGATPVDFDPTAQMPGDVLAGFSFRGPTPTPLQNLQKPDITAPGVDILAAVPGGYATISGTSMSSPHVAGAALLVRQANPGWSASEVKSALQMTASKDGTREDSFTAWDWDDVGSGRVDLTRAALAGLVMDESAANFIGADPANGGDVTLLNLPGLRNVDCSRHCSWQRTVRNTLGSASSWTVSTNAFHPDLDLQVSPSSFTFSGDTAETQTLTITAAPQSDLTASVVFGEVVLTEDSAQAPDAHLTVAISGTNTLPPEIAVTPAAVATTLDIGQQGSEQLDIANVGDLDLTWTIEYGPTGGARGAATIWDQPAEGTGGIVSDRMITDTQGEFPVYSANDFLASPPQKIESIFTPGFWNGGDVSTADSISWFIYADDGGKPAGHPDDGLNSALWSYTAAPGSSGLSITDNDITLDVPTATGAPISLPEEGRYWLVVAPTLTTGDSPASGDWWNWSQGASVEAVNHLIDTTDFFNAGATEWTAQTSLGVAWSDTAFTLSGTVDCGAASPGWLGLSQESGTVAGSGSEQLALDMDATGLTPGRYTTHLCLASNDARTPLQFVPVTLEVTDPDVVFRDRFEQ